MTDFRIGYTDNNRIIEPGKQKPANFGIQDKKSVTDNVLDVSDASVMLQELETQDVSKVKFIKIGSDKYIEVDLHNPEERVRLISDLKQAILSDHKVKPSFLKADFE